MYYNHCIGFIEGLTEIDMINILYIHGYGSSSNSPSSKIDLLESEFINVYRVAPNYNNGFKSAVQEVLDFVKDLDINGVIGTSMGGYMAPILGKPYVSINPCLFPSISLEKYNVCDESLSSYPDLTIKNISGLVLIGMNDTVIDPVASIDFFQDKLPILVDDSADHQFSDLSKYIDNITSFLFSANSSC